MAGRERMLTEKINKKAIQLVYMKEEAANEELKHACEEFEQGLYGLLYGDEILGLAPLASDDLDTRLRNVVQYWQVSKQNINQISLGIGNQEEAIKRINKNSDEIIFNLEKIVKLIEEKGTQHFEGLMAEKTLLGLFNTLFIFILFVTWRLNSQLSKSEKRYRLLVDHSPFGIMILNNRRIQFINESGLQTFGFTKKNEALGSSIFDFIHQEDHSLADSRLEQIRTSKRAVNLIEERFLKRDGTTVYVRVMSLPFPSMGQDSVLTIFHDITDRKRSENAFEKIYNQLHDITSALEDSSIITITDANGKIIHVNDQFCEISKFGKDELVGMTHHIVNSEYHPKEFFQDLWKTIRAGKVWEGHVKNRSKNGDYYWVNSMIIPFINQSGEPYQYLTIQNDISTQKYTEKEIEILATQDELTKLANRRSFTEKLQQKINAKAPISILFLDLDRFKFINDSLGHDIGDKLLQKVANRLKMVVGNEGIVSRQGGDEFTILINNIDRNFLSELCHQVINKVKNPYYLGGQKIIITCSIGISLFPKDGETVEKLLRNADIAMYQAKERGRDNFIFYRKEMSRQSHEVMQIEQELRTAIEEEEFVLHYQPKLALKTDKIIGMEALIRWVHPEKGMIPPGDFIPLAEETGLINTIGEWVLKQACVQNKKLHDAGYTSLIVSVNISAYQFKQEDLVSSVAQIIEESGLASQFIELEITESISMYSEQLIMEQLTALKGLGIKISIDDFGTGYSSLKYLMKFPIDTLKIDQSFISNISKENKQNPSIMTNAIISLAKSLHMEVVAEGVETMEQLDFLKKQHCDVGQGYFISKPLPVAELLSVLKNEKGELSYSE